MKYKEEMNWYVFWTDDKGNWLEYFNTEEEALIFSMWLCFEGKKITDAGHWEVL